MHTATALQQLAAISNGNGPGMFLRIIVIVTVLGVAALAVILMRAYRD
ncbi:hypothetical protein [Streptacidiphilus monticola]|jgi:hypothetical protein|uniref:Uncharacterized protein n=1 Tax=Streptacidiphilus monticola TaxID=2161674 RepID=A0ABW1FZL8_9ACTN